MSHGSRPTLARTISTTTRIPPTVRASAAATASTRLAILTASPPGPPAGGQDELGHGDVDLPDGCARQCPDALGDVAPDPVGHLAHRLGIGHVEGEVEHQALVVHLDRR